MARRAWRIVARRPDPDARSAAGRAARPGGSADDSPSPPTKVVAVLGYSSRRGGGLHPICAARLRAAESVAADADAVVLSGWARRPHEPTEAELMAGAWQGPGVRLVADGDARTTVGNARGIAAEARRLGATEVVAATSAWHRRRARALLRAALGHDVELELVSPAARDGLSLRVREAACLLALPLQLASLRFRR